MKTEEAFGVLGREVDYPREYDPDLLFPIVRQKGRDLIGISSPLPFYGEDRWTAYECSWLNADGKPQIGIAEIIVPASTPVLIESKSLKLYLNSYSDVRFPSMQAVARQIASDLSQVAQAPIAFHLFPLSEYSSSLSTALPGFCIDDLPIKEPSFIIDPSTLYCEGEEVEETLHSHLLKIPLSLYRTARLGIGDGCLSRKADIPYRVVAVHHLFSSPRGICRAVCGKNVYRHCVSMPTKKTYHLCSLHT